MLVVREEKRLLADDGVANRISYSLVVRGLARGKGGDDPALVRCWVSAGPVLVQCWP
jgi:hypothetical protein